MIVVNHQGVMAIEVVRRNNKELISGTSKMLKTQGVEIHKQAMESNISVDTLKTAFEDCISAMDDISKYKQEALLR